MTEHTPYQKGIIQRFYEHRDTLALQKLSEMVSNLYLETSAARIQRSWKSIHAQLLAAGVPKTEVDSVVSDQDLGAVAKIVARLQ